MSATAPSNDSALGLAQRLLLLVLLGVLASLLVPAIENLRSQARASRCTNNLRLIGAGIHAFAADNNGMVVPYRGQPTNPNSPPQGLLWLEYLMPYCAEGSLNIDGKLPSLPSGADYRKDERFFYVCPDSPVPVQWRAWGNYALHPVIMKATNNTPPNFPLSRIVRPAQVILIADGSVTTGTDLRGGSSDDGSGQFFNRTYPYTTEAPNILHAPVAAESINSNTDGMVGWIRYRHQGRANCLHADGHVRAYAYADRAKEMTFARFVSNR